MVLYYFTRYRFFIHTRQKVLLIYMGNRTIYLHLYFSLGKRCIIAGNLIVATCHGSVVITEQSYSTRTKFHNSEIESEDAIKKLMQYINVCSVCRIRLASLAQNPRNIFSLDNTSRLYSYNTSFFVNVEHQQQNFHTASQKNGLRDWQLNYIATS